MANSKKKKKAGRPPKINPSTANGNGAPKATPPAGAGKETARIDLSEAKTSLDSAKTDLESARSDAGAGAPEDTTRIDLPKPPAKIKPKAKTETSKLDLASAHPAGEKDDTSRITLPNRKSETARISLSEARPVADPADAEPDQHAETQPIAKAEKSKKEDTFRIDLDEVKPAADEQGDFSPATSGIDTGAEKSRDAVLKQSTLRVDLSESEKSAPPAASRNQTMRVELDDKSPAPQNETARMDAPVAKAESTESVGTTRVPIDDEKGGDDVLKRRGATAAPAPAAETPPAPAAETPPAPAAETPPSPAPPPPAPEEELPEPVAAPRNETARVSPPAEAEKSKTARIEVPAELAAPAAGRPKTIRIKRADSTAGPLQAPVPDPNVKRSKGKKGKKPTIMADDDEVGTLYSVLALVSLIVMGVVVYVLLAQTLDPSLPWIGKVGL